MKAICKTNKQLYVRDLNIRFVNGEADITSQDIVDNSVQSKGTILSFPESFQKRRLEWMS